MIKLSFLKRVLTLLVLVFSLVSYGQTKVRGVVVDVDENPLPFCNVLFKGSIVGTTTDENGKFYLESDKNLNELEVSFVGFKTLIKILKTKITYDLSITLIEESESLDEVFIVTGKQSKKNNPAIDILKKIWARKKQNGLSKFKQYQFEKYQKVEFDLNTIDEKLKKSRAFKGLEFVFENVDTSSITGKTYLPFFLSESVSKVYGDNVLKKEKEVLLADQNSGFSNNNEELKGVIENLYSDYNIYDNHLKFFDKSFASPLSRTGVSNYNYALVDSSFIGNKWCYNIVYYPRRKNELTFKGDFWVNDTTFAVKEINMQVVKSANVNWVRDIYVEQEFDLLNDTTFVLKRDYFLSDFSINNRDKSKGIYGKRTTIYKNYIFDKPINEKNFYKKKVSEHNDAVNHKGDSYWEENRPEKLNEDEQKVFKMLDTLNKVKKFKNFKKIVATVSSGYFEIDKLNFDYGTIFSTIGFNDVEGFRLRAGGRTYKTSNDLFRLEAYTAYGFKDKAFKYGFEAKWLLDTDNRLTITAGNKNDIEQIGAALTNSTGVLNRATGSSSVISTGVNDKLTNLSLTSFTLGIEPIPNFILKASGNYKKLSSASDTFSLSYNETNNTISSEIEQFETGFSVGYYPGRKMAGLGVQRSVTNHSFPEYFAQVVKGNRGVFGSDFDYTKVQLSLYKLWRIGSLGRLETSLETGKTFGNVPLALLNIAPGNQTYYLLDNTFNLLDFYEFTTDEYAAIHLVHNFNGRIMSRIPLLKKTKLRTIIGFKAFLGDLSDQNKAISTTGNSAETALIAPSLKPYYEYSVGVDNIFKVIRLNFNFRGNYLKNTPDVRTFGITAGGVFIF